MIHRYKSATTVKEDAIFSAVVLCLVIMSILFWGEFCSSKTQGCNREPELPTYEGSAIVVNETLANEMIPMQEDDLNRLLEEVYLDEIEELRTYTNDLEKEIVALQQTSARSTGRIITRTIETTVPVEFEPIEQSIDLDFDSTIVPIGLVDLSSSGDLRVQTFDLQLELDNLTTRNSDNSITTISRLTAQVNGESYDIPITSRTSYVNTAFVDTSVSGDTNNEPREPRFLFRPNLNLNLSPAYSSGLSVVPSIGLGLMHFRTKDRTSIAWTFISPNVGFDSSSRYLVLSLSPVLYNIGLPLPLVNDLFIGPAIGVDYRANPYYILQIGTSL
jgi:hypothetical protein